MSNEQRCETRELLPGSRYGVLRHGAQFAIVGCPTLPAQTNEYQKGPQKRKAFCNFPDSHDFPRGMTMNSLVLIEDSVVHAIV